MISFYQFSALLEENVTTGITGCNVYLVSTLTINDNKVDFYSNETNALENRTRRKQGK